MVDHFQVDWVLKGTSYIDIDDFPEHIEGDTMEKSQEKSDQFVLGMANKAEARLITSSFTSTEY